jgi:hypothetical protein
MPLNTSHARALSFFKSTTKFRIPFVNPPFRLQTRLLGPHLGPIKLISLSGMKVFHTSLSFGPFSLVPVCPLKRATSSRLWR